MVCRDNAKMPQGEAGDEHAVGAESGVLVLAELHEAAEAVQLHHLLRQAGVVAQSKRKIRREDTCQKSGLKRAQQAGKSSIYRGGQKSGP